MNPIVDQTVNQIVVHIAYHTADPLADNSLVDNSVIDLSNKDVYYKENEIVNGYSILQIIGEGRYGIAYLAINDKYEKCIIKQLKKKCLKKPEKNCFMRSEYYSL